MQRRNFLKLLAGGSALAMMPRLSFGNPGATDPFWIHVHAQGGWDQAVWCDPKPDIRNQALMRELYIYGVPYLNSNGQTVVGQVDLNPQWITQVRQTPGGGITYLGFADFHADLSNPNYPYKPFFPNYYDRITIFNGVDTGTNNHTVGARYGAAGSSNEGSPCFASQVAAVRGGTMPLAFLDMGGYDETAGLLPATPVSSNALPRLLNAANPNDVSGDNSGNDTFMDPASLAIVQTAHQQRLQRLLTKLKLPGHQRALQELQKAEAAQGPLNKLHFNANDQSVQNAIRIGMEAYRQGIAISMNVLSGGFDAHQDNEQQTALALVQLFETLKFIIDESEAPANGGAPVPVVMYVSTDFGRTPYHTMSGTDHWPTSSVMVIQNKPAQQLGFNLPTNTVIGGTTSGDQTKSLMTMKVNPKTLKLDSNGVTLTPGHIIRAMRRLAKIDSSPIMAKFPLSVDQDIAIG